MITGMPRIAIAVHDFSAVIETFRDKFGIPVIDLSETSVDSLGARLAMCVPSGGSNIELMSPAVPDAPLSQSLQGFLDRRGEGLFALMLEAPDPNAEAEDLIGRGLNVIPLMEGASGRDIHPNSTHGVLIRVYPVNSFTQEDPMNAISADPPGLSGIKRVIIAVKDLARAREVYDTKLAMPIDEPTIDINRGVKSSICRPPSGGLIELVSVEDQSRPFAEAIGDFLKDKREGMYAVVLQSRNPETAEIALKAKNLEVTSSTDLPGLMQVEQQFGVRFLVEQG